MLVEMQNFLFVLPGLLKDCERAQVSPLPRRLGFLAGIGPVFAGLQLANHRMMDADGGTCVAQSDAADIRGE
jgi:hypothetical protein